MCRRKRKSGREGPACPRRLSVTGAGAPGPSPSDNTTLTLSPRRGATYTAEATNRGEGGNKTRPALPHGERVPPPPSPPAPPPPALLSPAAAWPFSSSPCSRRRCRRCRSTNYIRATQRLQPSANLGSFRRAPPLLPSALLPSPRSSGRPPSANLGSLRFSSSFEAWLAASRAVSSFRLLLLLLAITSGHCRSSLRRVLPGDPLEAGPRDPGVRGEGAAFGRRMVGRERSHLGLSKAGWGYCACAEMGAEEEEGALGERCGRRPPPLPAGAGWSQTLR